MAYLKSNWVCFLPSIQRNVNLWLILGTHNASQSDMKEENDMCFQHSKRVYVLVKYIYPS